MNQFTTHPDLGNTAPASTPPPLGDLSTRRLVALALMAFQVGHLPCALRVRGASLDDARRELRRREVLNVGPGR